MKVITFVSKLICETLNPDLKCTGFLTYFTIHNHLSFSGSLKIDKKIQLGGLSKD